MQLYDLREGASGKGATRRGRCGIDSILGLIELATAKLTGVDDLTNRRATSAARLSNKDKSFGEEAKEWTPDVSDGESVIVEFSSEPSGAVVIVDGDLLCQATPCSKSLSIGEHSVSMQKERYSSKKAVIAIEAGSEVNWKLSPNYGTLNITSEPSGIAVKLNGKAIGTTPIKDRQLAPGRYRISINDKCYLKKGQDVSIEAPKNKSVILKLEPRQSAIKVNARDSKRNALKANIFVDGRKIGQAPGTFKVPLCSRGVQLQHPKGRWSRKLKLKEHKVSKFKAVLSHRPTSSKLTWIYSPAAKVYFTQTEITVKQFKKCVERGPCNKAEYNTHKLYRTNKEGVGYFYGNWTEKLLRRRKYLEGPTVEDFKANPTIREAPETLPMNGVSAAGASVYCRFVGARLPTLHEWRAEATNQSKFKYPWGDEKPNCEITSLRNCHAPVQPPCSKPASNSISGLCDMYSNLSEWVSHSATQPTSYTSTGKWAGSIGLELNYPAGASWKSYQKSVHHIYRETGFRCASKRKPKRRRGRRRK